MATGYTGSYRAIVVDNADPMMEHRLQVTVPDIAGLDAVWATPSVPPGDVQVPSIGDEVTVTFEGGDSDYPVWQSGGGFSGSSTGGYGGMYRATVIDNLDPMQANRILVSVPEVPGADSTWATPSPSLSVSEVPAVGAEVWVQFEGGDPSHPVWVGVP